MQIEKIDEVKTLFIDIENLFMNVDDVKRKLEIEIDLKEAEQQDYLHELEIANLNGMEIMKLAKDLKRVRKERRALKDNLELVMTVKGYADKYITKGIVADTRQAISNIETLKSNQATREYTPRVIKNLKCAKVK